MPESRVPASLVCEASVLYAGRERSLNASTGLNSSRCSRSRLRSTPSRLDWAIPTSCCPRACFVFVLFGLESRCSVSRQPIIRWYPATTNPRYERAMRGVFSARPLSAPTFLEEALSRGPQEVTGGVLRSFVFLAFSIAASFSSSVPAIARQLPRSLQRRQ